MTFLVTGANGFIGRMLCGSLSSGHKVIGVDIAEGPEELSGVAWETADIADSGAVYGVARGRAAISN